MMRSCLFPFLLALLLSAAAAPVRAEAGPGDVFREYTYANRFHELDPGAANPGSARLRAGSGGEKNLDIDGLGGAVRAEVSVEYWGGHTGTGDQKFRVNGNDWIQIPQPKNTPTPPQCYYRTVLGRATVPLPLESLKRGRNVFQFAAGPQICHSFDWGFYWVYSFTVRVYYKPSSVDTTGEITSPADGGRIGDYPKLSAKATGSHHTISRVDYVAYYEDFNWEGDGVYRQWHYQTERGVLRHHLGTATAPPYAVTWDTSWVPDQDQPVRIVAWITNNDGVTYVTPEVKVTLSRPDRSVKMYKPYDVPEVFGVRVKQRKTCKIAVADDPAKAVAARLFLSTWSAAHAEEIGLNDRVLVKSIGPIHNYSYDAIPVPLDTIRKGVNTFHIYASTQEHAAEVNWPGPALMLEFRKPPDVAEGRQRAAWWDAASTYRLPVSVAAFGYARQEKPVELDLDFTAILKSLGVGELFNAESVRMTEVDQSGAVVEPGVPFQFDRDANFHPSSNARGTLVFLLQGSTAPAATRYFHVYFGGPSRRPPAPAAAVALTDDVEYEGQKSYRIATPAAAYYYHKEGAGFARIEDRDGNDWVGYHPGGGSAGEYRGIPNLGECFHPGYSGSKGARTTLESAGPLRVRFRSETVDGRYAATWDVYSAYARMTLHRAAGPYWFLYEGTPGGKLDVPEDFWVNSAGVRRPVAEDWHGNLESPKWVYFADGKIPRALFLANHQDDTANDQFWQMESNMTVWGFGREYRCCRRYLTATPAQFSIGLLETTDHARAAAEIAAVLAVPKVTVGQVEFRNGK